MVILTIITTILNCNLISLETVITSSIRAIIIRIRKVWNVSEMRIRISYDCISSPSLGYISFDLSSSPSIPYFSLGP
jgi:hypothetical protein